MNASIIKKLPSPQGIDSHDQDHNHGKPGIMHYLWNTDHKMIAMQFLC